MAIPWSLALKAIPWATVLANAPAMVRAADTLLSGARARKAPGAAPDELQTLASRVEALEQYDHSDAELVTRFANQIDTLTSAIEVLAARQRWLLALGIFSAALAAVAMLLAVGSR